MNNIEKSYIDIIVDLQSRLAGLEAVESEKDFWANYAINKDIARKQALDIVKDSENDSEEVKALKKQVREVLV